MKQNLYVLGHPVAHSKSPVMHNAAYRALGLDWEYGFADCATEEQAREFLDGGEWLALNITMPYKPLALSYADAPSDAAVLAGGANVLVSHGGALHADNTDGKGCVSYLQRCGTDFEGAAVAVCGTGPTSLSIMHACVAAGARSIALLGRDGARCERALAMYGERVRSVTPADGPQISRNAAEFYALAYAGACEFLREADVILDATPLGMHGGDPAPFDTSVLSSGQTVFDVVYGHGETALIAAARAAGCAAFDGAGMLVAQAVETVIDLAEITGAFSIPDSLDLFSIMAEAAGFDRL